MCVVALTASIAACNIKLVDDLSAVRHECDTERILVAPVHSKEYLGDCMYDVTLKNRDKGINWSTAVFMALFHVGAVAALFVFNWKAVLVAILLWWVAGSLGVGIGFHRLLTHRSYKTPKLVEYFLTMCGTLALEGGPIYWVVTHRIHHAHADGPGDPHTPRDGGWWSHMGWILRGTAQQYDNSVLAHYAPDLIKDKFHIWLNRLYWLPLVLLGLVLLATRRLVISDVGHILSCNF